MSVGVIDEFRGKGIAKKLIEIVKEKALKIDRIKYLSLDVAVYNPSAN